MAILHCNTLGSGVFQPFRLVNRLLNRLEEDGGEPARNGEEKKKKLACSVLTWP